MPPTTQGSKAVTGPPQALISRIQYLQKLLKGLPSSVPLDPPEISTTYFFGLDDSEVQAEGVVYALTQNLERCFQTHMLVSGEILKFRERGKRCEDLVKVLKTAMRIMTPSDREFIADAWVERLIEAAQSSGAKVLPVTAKRRHPDSADEESGSNDSSDEGSTDSCIVHSSPRQADPRSSSGRPLTTHKAMNNDETLKSDKQAHLRQATLTAASFMSPRERGSTTSPPLARKPLRRAQAKDRKSPEAVQHTPNGKLDNFIASWKALSPEQRKVQDERRSAMLRERLDEMERAKEAEEKRKEDKKRKDGLIRIKRFREKKRQAKALEGDHQRSEHTGRRVKQDLLGSGKTTIPVRDAASISRPDATWNTHRNGTKRGVVPKKRERMNYFHPFLWCHVDRVARKCGFSATFTSRTLARDMPELFGKLSKSTVQGWLSRHGQRWSTRTMENVERRRALSGKGRTGFLAKYPEIVEEVKAQLIGLRKTGISVNRVLGRAIFVAVIEERNPAILSTFKCSEWFVGQFYSSVLRWSVRKGTRAAAHIPDNAQELCERTFFRIVHLAMVYDIPPQLWINLDQQGVYILPHNQITYHDTNAKQVDTHGKEEKRAYTLCVASSAAGDFLPFQQVWSGKTAASLPSRTADGMQEAQELGFDFTFAQSSKRTSHFSTLKTMKEWMVNILKPYIEEKIAVCHLPPDQRAILLIDCYPVHTGIEFRTYVWTKFPNIFLIFVPANCTGIFQPADVGLQRIIKHHLRQAALHFLVAEHRKQIKSGLTPEQVKVTTSLPVLRNASVRGIVDAWQFMSGPSGRDIVRRAWERCVAGDWNLSPEMVQSRQAKQAYQKYLATDEVFRTEITKKIGNIDDLTGFEPENEELEKIAEDEETDYDDTGVPLSEVVREVLGAGIPNGGIETPGNTCDGLYTSNGGVGRSDKSGFLYPLDSTENIWAFDESGEPLNTQSDFAMCE